MSLQWDHFRNKWYSQSSDWTISVWRDGRFEVRYIDEAIVAPRMFETLADAQSFAERRETEIENARGSTE